MFELSDDHEMFRKVMRDFAEREVAPHIAQWDRDHHFPVHLIPKLGELGVFGLGVPEEYGGTAGDFTSACIAIEELGRVDQSIGITLEAGIGLGTYPILTFGTEAQKRQWLPELAAGRALAAFGLTEPNAGSDAGATRTTAKLDCGEWIVDGSKIFITNAGTDITSCVTITALTDEGEISNIIVPNGTPGYVISEPMHKLGWRASDTRELSFQSARVPEQNLLGPPGEGFRQ